MSARPELEAKPAASTSPPADDRTERTAAAEPAEADLAYARAAAADALGRGAKANSVPWENPQTGVSGNITPLAATHSEDGLPCRDFLASYVRGGSQSWLQGEPAAPRPASGKSEASSR